MEGAGRAVGADKGQPHDDLGALLDGLGADVVVQVEPGTEDAERLALLTVVGTQQLGAAP